MEVKLVLASIAIMVFAASTVGVICKLWMYGVKDFRLVLSPVILIVAPILPIITLHRVLFKSNNTKINELFFARRVRLFIIVGLEMLKGYSSFVGYTCSYLAGIKVEVKIRGENSEVTPKDSANQAIKHYEHVLSEGYFERLAL